MPKENPYLLPSSSRPGAFLKCYSKHRGDELEFVLRQHSCWAFDFRSFYLYQVILGPYVQGVKKGQNLISEE